MAGSDPHPHPPSNDPTGTNDTHDTDKEKETKPKDSIGGAQPAPSLKLLFAHCTRRDAVTLLLPAITVSAIAGGIAPFMTKVIGQAFDAFSRYPLPSEQALMSADEFQAAKSKLLRDVGLTAVELLGLAAGSLLVGGALSWLWIWVAEKNVMRLRRAVYEGVTMRRMEWFDAQMAQSEGDATGAGGMMAKFARDTDDIRAATSLAMGHLIQYLVTIIVALILALATSWSLTLIILSSIPVIIFLQGIAQALAMPRYDTERALLSRSATVTTTSLSAIATIKSFNAQASTYTKISELLNQVRKTSNVCSAIWSSTSGGTQFVLFAMFVQGFWFGSTLVRKGSLSPGQVMTVFWACLIAATNLQVCIPILVTITKGKNAAAAVAGLLDPSDGECPEEDGKPPTHRTPMSKIIPTRNCLGELSLHNVTFAYPSRPDQVVLKDVSMFIPAKDMTFVVGGSGSGKSTIAQIVTGMYKIRNERTRPRNRAQDSSGYSFDMKYPTTAPGSDADAKFPEGPAEDQDEAAYFSRTPGGMVVLDDQQLQTLDERWIRKHVALVSQQCVLFDMSVHDNVAIGLAGNQTGGEGGQENKLYQDDSDVPASSRFVPRLSREKVVEACKLARLHDFISELPDGYDTILNGGGGGGGGETEAGNGTENRRISLSGGQKQRLAIARAWVRDPTVLILDEATSALDATTRTLVFDAIRAWRRNKTTIVITHDLAQIAPADFVYVMKSGQVVQEGHRHNLEIERGGAFEGMISHKGVGEGNEDESEVSSEDGYSIRGQGHDEYTLAGARQVEEVLEDRPETGVGLAYPGPGLSYTPFVPYGQYPSIAESSIWMLDAIADISGYTTTPAQSYRHRHPSNPPLPAIEVHTSLHRRRTSVDPRGRTSQSRPENAAHGGGNSRGADVVRRASLQWEPRSAKSATGEPKSGWPRSGSIKRKSLPVYSSNQNAVRWSQKHEDSDGDSEVDNDEKKPFQQDKTIVKTGWVATVPRKHVEERMDPIIEDEKTELDINNKAEPQQPPKILSVVKRFYPTVPNKLLVVFGLIVSVVNGTMVPLFSFLLATLMTEVSAGGRNVSQITRYALYALLAAAGDGITEGLKFYTMEVAAMNWVTSLRKRCLELVLAQDKRWHDEPAHSAATIAQVLIKDGEDAQLLIATVIPQFITVVMMILTGLLWAVAVCWQLTLVGFAVGPFFAVVMVVQVQWSGKIELRNKRAREEVSKQYYNAVANVRAIRAMALESAFKAQFEESLVSAMKSGVQGAFVAGCGVGVVNGLIYSAEAALFYVSAVLMVREGYTYLRTVQALNLVVFSVTLGGQIMSFVPRIVKAVQATHDFGQFLFLDTDTQESRGMLRFRIEGDLSYNHIQFSYPTQPDLLILKDINFKVKQGECVAIVGPSGCGKSTIVSLLQRLYEPNSGSIQTGEHSIASANVRYLREHIAVVSQHPALFDATVTENIMFGSTDTTFDDVQDAARAAQMHDWIMSQERGYDTMLGEGAALISGGQAQRLQIARALVRKANVLVMDEATSALDPANQDAIMDTVMAIKQDRITLVVTHKVAVMQRCDRILVVQDGVIAEEGSYQELMDRRGAFFKIASGNELE